MGIGTISNCKNYADINGNPKVMGGIVGKLEFSGSIEKCINNGAISTSSNKYRILGGIIGELGSGSVIECANKGCCTRRNIQTEIGGICGRVNSESEIKSCYVTGAGDYATGGNCGGMFGFLDPNSSVDSCYICGELPTYCMPVTWNDSKVDNILNCYYNKEIEIFIGAYEYQKEYNATGLTTEEMKSPEFLTMLGNKYKADTNNINDGYPILSFE